MKKYIKASYEDKFWQMHDSSMEVGMALEDVVEDLGFDGRGVP